MATDKHVRKKRQHRDAVIHGKHDLEGTCDTYTVAQARGDPVEGGLSEMGPVEPPIPGPVPALLSCTIMPPARHVGTQTRAETQRPHESCVVPYPNPFFISVVAIRTVITVRFREPSHKGTVLEKPRLGILNKPSAGVIIVNDFPAPQN